MKRWQKILFWLVSGAAALQAGAFVALTAYNLTRLPVPDLAWRTPVIAMLGSMVTFISLALFYEQHETAQDCPPAE